MKNFRKVYKYSFDPNPGLNGYGFCVHDGPLSWADEGAIDAIG